MATLTMYGKTRQVKNLGWLLRHWKEVSCFEITEHVEPYSGHKHNALMSAYIFCGGYKVGTYEIVWCSTQALRTWLDRPVFRGIRVTWFGQECVAGKIP